MSTEIRNAKYIRTDIVFVTYDENIASNIIEEIRRKYKVLKIIRSRVVRELYYLSVEGKADDIDEHFKRSEVKWFKKDYIVFR